ncbi:MAG TPA: glycosyltransferase family 4 protein [Candidatus Dormibacteraeota bacterium]|nr:glycosyltransferase family 4 protein [Candidatus Dormibacteraeota bacterium]
MRSETTFRRLRVALVPPLWARVAPATQGGVEYIVYLLAEELVRRGHEVTVFTSRDSPTTARIEAVCEWNMIEAMERGCASEYEYYETCNIAEVLRKSDSFDIVHFHVGGYAIPLGTLSRAPVVHTLHNPITPDAIWLLERYPDATVTGVSRHQINAVPLGRRQSIRVIRNACDFEAYELSLSPGNYLAFLGRMGPQKSPLDAIRIAKEAGFPIVLGGQPLDEDERAYFAEKIEPLINGIDVIYVGQVDYRKKMELLKHARALLFPIQQDEAFGLVMIEAMACGTPVIAFERASVEEVVDFGKTGFYARSIQALSSFVPRALTLDRKVVRDHARQRFGHARMIDEYLQVYESVLNATGMEQPSLAPARHP